MALAGDLTQAEIIPPFGQDWVVQLYESNPSEWLGTELVERINNTNLEDRDKINLARQLLDVRRQVEQEHEAFASILVRLMALSFLVGFGLVLFSSALWVVEGEWLSYTLSNFTSFVSTPVDVSYRNSSVGQVVTALVFDVDVVVYLFFVAPILFALLLQLSKRATVRKLRDRTDSAFKIVTTYRSSDAGFADLRGLLVMVVLIFIFSAIGYFFSYSSFGPGFLLPPLEKMYNQCLQKVGGSAGISKEDCDNFRKKCLLSPHGKSCRKYQEQLFDIKHPSPPAAEYVAPEASPPPYTPIDPFELGESSGSQDRSSSVS